jgi:hypothetical protein
MLGRFEASKSGHALDQGSFDPPHAREIKLSLRGNTSQLEHHFILRIAGDLIRQSFQLSLELLARDGQRQPVPVSVLACSLLSRI